MTTAEAVEGAVADRRFRARLVQGFLGFMASFGFLVAVALGTLTALAFVVSEL